jgi:hypothetical protein
MTPRVGQERLEPLYTRPPARTQPNPRALLRITSISKADARRQAQVRYSTRRTQHGRLSRSLSWC